MQCIFNAQCYCGGKYRRMKARKFAKVVVNACVLARMLCDMANKHAHTQ